MTKKIMFSDHYGLTQAVLEGRKTMTRRKCKEPYWAFSDIINAQNSIFHFEIPKYKIGEVVAIAQSYKTLGYDSRSLDISPKDFRVARGTLGQSKGWNNKMFVRSEGCKHHIQITNIKVEKLQDISDEDCLKEGVELNPRALEYDGTKYYIVRNLGHWRAFGCTNFNTPCEAFSALIDKVSGKGTWESNPFVWVYEFKLID